MVFAYLKNKQAVAELFREVAPKIADRPGGYCRILKTGFRQGDGAETCFIELVDFNGEYTQNAGAAKKAAPKGRTRRAGGAKKAAPAAETAAPAAAEAPVAETAETKAE